MSQGTVISPSKFCKRSQDEFEELLRRSKIEEYHAHDGCVEHPFLFRPDLPRNLVQITENGHRLFSQKRKCNSLVVTDQDMLHARAYTAVDTDKFDVGADYSDLCGSYDRMKHAREFGLGSEIELREGFDELFRLVFRDHPELKEEDDYWLELPLDLVKFDSTGMPAYPNAQAKIDGGVIKQISLPHSLPTGLPSYIQTYYIPSVIEYKSKDDKFMRQAILASASLQGINRSLRLNGAVNYAFSIDGRKGEVDVIISTWTEDNNGYRYLYRTLPSFFNVKTPMSFWRFHSFLCHLRNHHEQLVEMIDNVDLTKLNFQDIRNTFAQHVNGIGSEQDDNQMEEAEGSEISFGADAGTVGGIPLDQYCRGFESESESDELDFAESDSDDEEIKVDNKKINLVEEWAQNVDVVVRR